MPGPPPRQSSNVSLYAQPGDHGDWPILGQVCLDPLASSGGNFPCGLLVHVIHHEQCLTRARGMGPHPMDPPQGANAGLRWKGARPPGQQRCLVTLAAQEGMHHPQRSQDRGPSTLKRSMKIRQPSIINKHGEKEIEKRRT
jgi:hypothetical protein